LAEAVFHDEKVDRRGRQRGSADLPELKRGNKRFYSTVARSKHYVHDWIDRHAPNRIVLDYACGQGELALRAARAGAELAIGLDISRTSIANARADATDDQLAGTTYFLQGDCEQTGLPDECVDVLICSGMLHHLDVRQAYPEMHRVLKPGGVCLAVEALDYNPLVKLYRRLTPGLRTAWEKEHILSHRELRLARRYFEVRNVRYWHLASILAAGLRRTPLFRPALAVGNAVDSVLLRVPPIAYMAWQFSFELHKPAAGNDRQPDSHATREAA
jgi:SAM-dependent methyltransferase